MQFLVAHLQFTGSELVRCSDGIISEEAITRFASVNSITWIIGHLANQENSYWVHFPREKNYNRNNRTLWCMAV
jgi:hypothetical protein